MTSRTLSPIKQFNLLLILTFLITSVMPVYATSSTEEISSAAIIPIPATIKVNPGVFVFDSKTPIIADETGRKEASVFVQQFRNATGFPLRYKEYSVKKKTKNAIVIRIVNSPGFSSPESYHLNVTPDTIEITAQAAAGLFYGMQTLRQMLPPEIESNTPIKGFSWTVPCVEIQDSPRFSWRGYMLDSSRHFQDVEYIKRVIDLLALYKMNRFHWHLVDDQGWRVEIKSHPELTLAGAYRPNINASLNYLPNEETQTYGGFYTQDQIRDVVAYAQSRHIIIIPEIEMPGHCLSALVTNPELSCSGKVPGELGNTWIYKDVYCPGNENTFKFIEDVLAEVIDLFPPPWIHIGGDECPKDRWHECPKCQERIAKDGLQDENGLHGYFIRRVEKFVKGKGRQLIGWDDNLGTGVSSDMLIQAYRGMDKGVEAAKQGHQVIFSPHTHCYFDYEYSATTVSKAYSLNPVLNDLTKQEADNILGVECCQWLGNVSRRYYESRGIAMPTHGIEYKTFPRLLATAEVGWSPQNVRNRDDFINRLKGQGARLDALSVNYYRIPDVWTSTKVSDTFQEIWSDPKLEKVISENIEKYRKSDVALALYDIKGNPLTNVEVTIEQTSHDFLFGSNIFVLGQLKTPEENLKYETAFRKVLNSATIPFYWLGLEPVQGELRYEEGSRHIWRRPPTDRVLAWCKQYDIVPKGHPILWHAHNPEWLPNDPEVVKELFLKRFHEIADRYGHEIDLWDGVNEPIDCVKEFALYDEERSYVEWAFREERKIFPDSAQLFINEMPHVCHEYNGEDPTQTRYYKHIQGLVDRNVPLDGIGFQFHIMSDKAVAEILGGDNYSPWQLLKVYELYDRFELPMYITEITMPTQGGGVDGEHLQMEMVKNYYRLWFSIPRMKGITWWNLGDGTAIEHETQFNGGLLRKNLDPKPGFEILDQLINHDWKTNAVLMTDDSGQLNFRGFHGQYVLKINAGDLTCEREIHVKENSDNEFKIALW